MQISTPKDSRRLRARRKFVVERLEDRVALAVDLALTTASTPDSRSIEFAYTVEDPITAPVRVAFFRSVDATADAGDQLIGERTLSSDDLTRGPHSLSLAVVGGLPIDPARPFVVTVADADNALVEANEANNAAVFRKYVVGAVTHGLQLDTTFPGWVPVMATSLEAAGYNDAIAFDWSNTSALPVPGWAVAAGRRMAESVVAAVQALPADSGAVDVHLIGHSRGGVVIAEALRTLETLVSASVDPRVKLIGAGFAKLTFLDSHPAHNVHTVGDPSGRFFSASRGPFGRLVTRLYTTFQAGAQDPDVVVPASADAAEVYYQRADVSRTTDFSEQILNIWGETPIPGATHVCDLTGTADGHGTVHDWYQANVVPTLRTAGGFLCPAQATVSVRASVATRDFDPGEATSAPVPLAGGRGAARGEFRLLFPRLITRRAVAASLVQQLAMADRAFAQGRNVVGARRLGATLRFVAERRGRSIRPELADFFAAATTSVLAAPR